MLEIWTDGSTRPKKISKKKWEKVGHSSIAVIIKKNGKEIKRFSKYVGILDNNQAEYEAFIEAVQMAIDLDERFVKFYTDSNLVEKQLNSKYNVYADSITPYYMKAKNLLYLIPSYEIKLISRKLNTEADKLTKMELDNFMAN
ncbi:14.7 kDa ribonuclease H-like protein [compost metagenome]